MLKISDAVAEIIRGNPALRTGLAQRLMNLSRVARHIRPAVEARTHKAVQQGAIAMALSRLQAGLRTVDEGPDLQLANRITVQRGLAVLTFPNTRRLHRALPTLQEKIREDEGHLTITEGVQEITLIIEAGAVPLARATVGEPEGREWIGVASLSIALTNEHLGTPGVLYRLLQPLALQGVNLAEVASTSREFHIYIGEEDVMLALDSLYATFGRN